MSNRPLEPDLGVKRQRPKPFKQQGGPSSAIYGGYVHNIEKDSELSGNERFETFSTTLANCSIVSACVRHFLSFIAKAEWNVLPKDDSEEAAAIAAAFKEYIEETETPWHRIVRRSAMYVMYGFSVQEWIALKREDGTVGIKDIQPRAQATIERFDVSKQGDILGFIQRRPQDSEEVYIPRAKCIYLRDDSLNDTPEGLGLFRHVHDAAKRLRKYEYLENVGFETDLRGIPVARGPFSLIEQMVQNGQLSKAQAMQLKQPMIDFIEQHSKNPALGMLLDSQPYVTTDEQTRPSNVPQWNIELLQGDPNSSAEVAAAIERVNREIARVMGCEHLLLGSNDRGSYAMAESKSVSFGMLVDSTLKEIRETFERDLLKPIALLNGWDMSLLPKMEVEKIQYRTPLEVAEAMERLAGAGVSLIPGDPAVDTIRDLIGLPRMPDDILEEAKRLHEQANAPAPAPATQGEKKAADKEGDK
jgi:hypothetical protein